MRRRLLSVGLSVMLAVVVSPSAHAGEPTEQLKADIARVFEAVEAPAPRDAIREVSRDLFDWAEMSRQSLGRYWRERTETEREEFMSLLGGIVDAQIATLAGYRGDTIAWVGESVEGDRARIRTRISTKRGRDLVMDYHMIRRGARWLISDVALDGASMVGSYRAQFYQIIKTASYQKLVETLAAQ